MPSSADVHGNPMAGAGRPRWQNTTCTGPNTRPTSLGRSTCYQLIKYLSSFASLGLLRLKLNITMWLYVPDTSALQSLPPKDGPEIPPERLVCLAVALQSPC